MELHLEELFVNWQCGATLIIFLGEMDHQQPPTPVITESATGGIFENNNIRQRISRAIDMILYWVRDRVRKRNYILYWARVKENSVDYFTKHYPTKHHRAIRIIYLFPTADSSKHSCYQVPRDMWGCINPPVRETNNVQTRYPPDMSRHSTDRHRHATR